MIMCRDLNFDDVKDINVSMQCSAFDVLAAVVVRGKEILEQHLAMEETKRGVKRTHDGEASTSTSVAAWGKGKGKGKEILIEEHLAMDAKISVKRTYDGEAPPKKRIKCNSKVDLSLNFRPPLPEGLDKLIREMAREKILTPPTLLIQKRLFDTDLSKGHNRLSIPIRLITDDFLTEEEKRYVCARDAIGRKNFIQVTMIEPSLATETVEFRQWDMAKGNGGRTSSTYVINGSWYEIAMRNKLKPKMEVQLWSFRLDGDFCFALVRPPPPMLSF